MTAIRIFNFHGDELATFEHEGRPVVALRPIVEALGLDWKAQYDKVHRDPVLAKGVVVTTIPSAGGPQATTALAVDLVPLFLAKISAKRVREEVRPKLIRYQIECGIALRDYWFKGAAVRGDMDGVVTSLDAAVASQIGGIVKSVVRSQLADILPVMVAEALERDPRHVAIAFAPALDLLKNHDVPPRKRRGLVVRVSALLRSYSALNGYLVRRSRESGRWLFDPVAMDRWYRETGAAVIRAHLDRVQGQSVLPFVVPKQPKGD